MLDGVAVLVQLHQDVDAGGPSAKRSAQILAGMFRLARRESVPPPGPEVMEGMLGRGRSEAVCRVWPLVRAFSALELIVSGDGAGEELGTEARQVLEREAEKVLREAAAWALLQGVGRTGAVLWSEIALWSKTKLRVIARGAKHDVGLGNLVESLLRRPLHAGQYKPRGEIANVIAYAQRVARTRLADESLRSFGISPSAMRRMAKDGVPLSKPKAVAAEFQRRLLRQRNQVEGRLTQRQVARGLRIPGSTLRLALERVKAAGRTVGMRTGRNITFDATDIPIIREHLRKHRR